MESSGVRSRERNGLVLGTLLPICLRGNFRSMTSRSAVWKSGGVSHRLAVISCHCDPVLQNLMAWGILQRIWVRGAQIFQKSKNHVKILGDTKQVSYWRPTNYMCQRTKFSSHGDMRPRFVHHWSKYTTQFPMRSTQKTGHWNWDCTLWLHADCCTPTPPPNFG